MKKLIGTILLLCCVFTTNAETFKSTTVIKNVTDIPAEIFWWKNCITDDAQVQIEIQKNKLILETGEVYTLESTNRSFAQYKREFVSIFRYKTTDPNISITIYQSNRIIAIQIKNDNTMYLYQ
jgi:hypothetical protein